MNANPRNEFDEKYHYDIARACVNCNFFYDITRPDIEKNYSICEKRTAEFNTTLYMCVCDLYEPIDYGPENMGRRFEKYKELSQ